MKIFNGNFQELKFEWLQQNDGYKLKSSATLMRILHKLIYDKRQNWRVKSSQHLMFMLKMGINGRNRWLRDFCIDFLFLRTFDCPVTQPANAEAGLEEEYHYDK